MLLHLSMWSFSIDCHIVVKLVRLFPFIDCCLCTLSILTPSFPWSNLTRLLLLIITDLADSEFVIEIKLLL